MRPLAACTTITAALALAACARTRTAPAPAAPLPATAELRDGQGRVVGTARALQDTAGVRITVEVRGMPPGPHGIHLHAVGTCTPPDFASAGPHFNPAGMRHGLENPEGAHAGDFPNLDVAADGTGSAVFVNARVTLGVGLHSLFDADGTALVVHAAPDDQRTDPSGASGGRLACGIFRR